MSRIKIKNIQILLRLARTSRMVPEQPVADRAAGARGVRGRALNKKTLAALAAPLSPVAAFFDATGKGTYIYEVNMSALSQPT